MALSFADFEMLLKNHMVEKRLRDLERSLYLHSCKEEPRAPDRVKSAPSSRNPQPADRRKSNLQDEVDDLMIWNVDDIEGKVYEIPDFIDFEDADKWYRENRKKLVVTRELKKEAADFARWLHKNL